MPSGFEHLATFQDLLPAYQTCNPFASRATARLAIPRGAGYEDAVDFAVEVSAPAQDRSQALGGHLPSFLEKSRRARHGA